MKWLLRMANLRVVFFACELCIFVVQTKLSYSIGEMTAQSENARTCREMVLHFSHWYCKNEKS